MIFYDRTRPRSGPFAEKSYGMFSELTVNGQPADDDNDQPTDYTAGDDSNATETNTPPEGQDNTPEPVEGGEGNEAEDYTAQGGEEGSDNPTDAPEDYTVPDESNDTTPDAQPAPAEGEGEGAPEDYTGGEDEMPAEGEAGPDEGGGDPGGAPPEGGGEGAPPAEGGGDPGAEGGDGAPPEGGEGEAPPDGGGEDQGGDDYGGGGGDDSWDSQIKELQKDIYGGELSEPQGQIRDKELKNSFNELFDLIDNTIERINDIQKDSDMLKSIEYVTNKLNELGEQVSDYLVYTFDTKTYTENAINYKRFIIVLSQINDILSKIKPAGQNDSDTSQ